jgi:hypothetical protein
MQKVNYRRAIRIWMIGLLILCCSIALAKLEILRDRGALGIRPTVNITPGIKELVKQNLARADDAIARYDATSVKTSDTPWTLFHGLLGHHGDFQLDDSTRNTLGEKISCEDWLLRQASAKPIYWETPLVIQRDWGVCFTHGNIAVTERFEDHFCQFLFILMNLGVDPDRTTVRVPPDGHAYTLRQMVTDEQKFCNGAMDVSWALPLFAQWGTPTWTNKFNEQGDLGSLMTQHLDLEEHCDACFGTHWRMGLAMTLSCAADRLPVDVRQRANNRLLQLLDEAHNGQDSESGRFRLEAAAAAIGIRDLSQLSNDRSAVLSHQGHTLEWLMVALPDDRLATEMWPHKGIKFLLDQLQAPTDSLNYGAYSHCADALRLYQKRMRAMLQATG